MSDGTVADSSDILMILVRVVAMMLMFVFSSAVDKGSREQDLRGHLFTNRMIAVGIVDVNAAECDVRDCDRFAATMGRVIVIQRAAGFRSLVEEIYKKTFREIRVRADVLGKYRWSNADLIVTSWFL